MVLGINPEQLKKVQAVSQHISAVITANYNEQTVNLKLSADSPEAQGLVDNLIQQFADALAMQLSSFFAIKGELIDIGKK